MSLKPKVISDITSIHPYNKLSFLTSQIENMLDYTLTGGIIASGLNIIYIYKMIPQAEKTPENLELAVLMGWCLRLVSITINLCNCRK